MYKVFSEALHNNHQCTSSSARRYTILTKVQVLQRGVTQYSPMYVSSSVRRYTIFTNVHALNRGVTQYSPMNKRFSEALHNTHQCTSSSARRYTILTNEQAFQRGVTQLHDHDPN
ncbi:hypothetical protein DPMN_136331 [Dreissena polymorpha]|uniref:Uncharacterized protein n=1 Tax=Dreissena polymorpha TaxID=45954 RepID=A0A9D4FZT5_DREPO|nr:hypothetical protein DPMN_136331 [Dreissena polymorpha]